MASASLMPCARSQGSGSAFEAVLIASDEQVLAQACLRMHLDVALRLEMQAALGGAVERGSGKEAFDRAAQEIPRCTAALGPGSRP